MGWFNRSKTPDSEAISARIAEQDALADIDIRRSKEAVRLESKRLDIADKQADAEIHRRNAEHQAQLDRAAAADRAKAAKRQRRAEERDSRAGQRQERKRRRIEQFEQVKTRIGSNVAGFASGVVYVIALGAAGYGQVTTATGMNQPGLVGLGFSVFLEGSAVAAAMTAHAAKVAGERAPLATAWTWISTVMAAAIQLWGHWDIPLLAAILAFASIAAVVVFHMRTAAAARAAARKRGEPARPRFGARRWIVAFASTFAAWRYNVLTSTNDEAGEAINAVAAARQDRRDAAAQRKHDKALLKAIKAGKIHIGAPVSRVETDDEGDDDEVLWDVPDVLPADWTAATDNTGGGVATLEPDVSGLEQGRLKAREIAETNRQRVADARAELLADGKKAKVSTIAELTGLSNKTVRKYLAEK